jgi:integrase
MKIGNRKYEPHYDERYGLYFTHLQVDGKRKYYGLGINKREAQKRLAELLRRKARGELITNSETTTHVRPDGEKDIAIRELAHKYLDWCDSGILAKSTYVMRRHLINQFLAFVDDHFGKEVVWVSELNRQVIESFRAQTKAEHKDSPNYGGDHLRTVKTMLRWGVELGWCAQPIWRFPSIPNPVVSTKNLTDDEVQKLLKVLSGEFGDMIRFGLLTGLRPIELRLLMKSHVENGKLLRIEHHKTSARSRVPTPRSVPLTAEAIDILRRQYKRHPDSPYVFLNEFKQPYSDDTFRQKFQRKCKRARIKIYTPYSTRHTFATIQAGLGISEAVGKAILGHTKSDTYMRYTRNNKAYHAEAVQVVGDHLRKLMAKPTRRKT